MCRNFHFANTIGRHIKEVVKVDFGVRDMCWKKVMCVQVTINILEPLKRGVFISVANGSNKWIAFS